MDLKFASRTLVLAVAGASFTIPALAQWQWIDKDGRKVYSDRSPPADIQEKDILKKPRGARMAAAPVASEEPAAETKPKTSTNANAPKLSGKDVQLETKKKQADEEEAAKKKADEEKVAAVKADTCERAKKGLSSIQSGNRVITTNAKGEREVLDDAAKAAETRRLQGIADNACK
ncbi:MAG: DUF4124 domain-containing protein [Polaromonas sp.]|nr:DUF4124 domain-containing protein [Polaromonas sp.]